MGRRSQQVRNSRNELKTPRLIDQGAEGFEDDDDEEIPEDEAFNSDDERKYGMFFSDANDDRKAKAKKKLGKHAGDSDDDTEDENDDDDEPSDEYDEEGDSESADGDEDDDGDGGQYMLDLLNQIDSNKNKSGSEDDPHQASMKLAPHVAESEFAASVVPASGLTLEQLMNELQDTQGFGVMQRSLRKVATGQATSTPAARVVTQRAERKVHYQEQSANISQWLPAVQQNRQAETLDFRQDVMQRMEITDKVLVDKFVPTTDFEKQLHDALQKAGQDDEEAWAKAQEEALQDDLGANNITLEEYKQRRGQLAKMRALLFYHEQKRHHINKIKSKKYRRIRKKQRERLKQADEEAQIEENPDLAKELEEKEEMERMKERMTLAHKNTSKWARRILKRGKNVDIDTRRALSAQLKRGDDLLKRMSIARDGEDDEDGSDEDLAETARKVVDEVEDDGDAPITGKGLFQLSFMQRGIEKQRELAREEARQLLMELEADNAASDDDEATGPDEPEPEPERKKVKVASKKEMAQVLKEGELVATSLKSGNANSLSVSGGIEISLGMTARNAPTLMKANNKGKCNASSNEHQVTLSLGTNSASADHYQGGRGSKELSAPRKTQSAAKALEADEEESNPWLVSLEAPQHAGAGPRKKKSAGSTAPKGMINVDRAIDVWGSDLTDARKNDKATTSKPNMDGEASIVAAQKGKKLTELTQEELIRRVFVSPSDDMVDEEFAQEKAAVEDEEEEPMLRKLQKEKSVKTVSGWGFWAGQGAPPPSSTSPKNLPKHLQAPSSKLQNGQKRARQDERKPHVIIRQQRNKKLANQFMIAQIPHPYTSREEYERAMMGAMGKEWNVSGSVKSLTRPKVMTRAGKIIQPLSIQVKQRPSSGPEAANS